MSIFRAVVGEWAMWNHEIPKQSEFQCKMGKYFSFHTYSVDVPTFIPRV